jgi:TonB family protein
MLALILAAALAQLATSSDVGASPVQSPPLKVIYLTDWLSKPTGDDVLAHYPSAAFAMKQFGWALMECKVGEAGVLTGCRTTREEPDQSGFGAAELVMSPLFRVAPTAKDGQPTAGRIVAVPLRFSVPPPIDPAAPLRQPEWIRRPNGADLARFYPSAARIAGAHGAATAQCDVLANGHLANCSVIAESPTGLGFGDATLKLTSLFRMQVGPDGPPIEGRRIKIPIHFGPP